MERLKSLLIRGAIAFAGRPTVEIGLASVYFARRVRQISKQSGYLFLALYLKQCSVHLQQYYATTDPRKLVRVSQAVSVSLTRSGLPRIIPKHHRHKITKRDDRADSLVRLWLTWFTLSRLIELAKPISRSTFQSMKDRPRNTDKLDDTVKVFAYHGHALLSKYLPRLPLHFLYTGVRWEPKSLPNSFLSACHIFQKSMVGKANRIKRGSNFKEIKRPSSFFAMKYELASFASFHLRGPSHFFLLPLFKFQVLVPFACQDNDWKRP
jgi:hypothetical protein